MIARALVVAALCVAAPHVVAADDGLACPIAFRGVSITATNLHDGVSLTFTTEHGRIAKLRDQLRAVAFAVEQRGTEVQTASYDEDVDFPPLDVEVYNIAGGARVSVRASRPRDIPALWDLAAQLAHYWAASPCNGDRIARR